jgi:hypothetical protein
MINRFVKPALVLGFAGALALSAVTSADAQRRSWRAGPGIGLGVAAGAFIAGAAIASSNSYYGPGYYDPGYAYGPGYAYAPSYGYADVDAYAYAPGPAYESRYTYAPSQPYAGWGENRCRDFQMREGGIC